MEIQTSNNVDQFWVNLFLKKNKISKISCFNLFFDSIPFSND